MTFPDGTRYEGRFSAGEPSGRAPDVLVWPDGGRYEGGFSSSDSDKVGPNEGVYTAPDGRRYEAEFVANGGLLGRRGVMTYPGGRRVTDYGGS